MKVIKEGCLNDSMQVTCNVCKAELEISSGDLTRTTNPHAIYYSFECPCCKTKLRIGWCQLPIGITKALRESGAE